MKNKRLKIIVILCLIGFIVTLGISYATNSGGSIDGVFSVKYDSTWRQVNGKGLKLEHKKSNSILSIQSKELEDKYIDTELRYLIDDIMDSVIEQNDDYRLINIDDNIHKKYDGYSYLFEKDMEQVLVNVYKKGKVIVISYYQADSQYYDIVLDSVDTILNSLEINK